jgi:hypothetical protein
MPKPKLPFELKCLVSFASNDPTRFVLHHIHAEDGWAVSTDGHRLFAVNTRESSLPVPEASFFSVKATEATGALIPALAVDTDGLTYPGWERVIPSGEPSGVFHFRVPEWFAKIKTSREPVILGFSGECLTVGRGAPDAPYFDARLMADFAGMEVYISLRTPELPAIIAPTEQGARDPKNAEWFALIMPIRAGESDKALTQTIAGKQAA